MQRVGHIDLRRTGHILRLVDDNRGQGGQQLRDALHQLTRALMGGGGHLHKEVALLLHVGAESVQLLAVSQQIGLVGHHDLGTGSQLRAVLLQLCVDGFKVGDGVATLAAGCVHHVYQQAAAVDVAQEIVAETCTLTGTLDDAGDVRHHEADTVLHPHNAQIGVKGGEVIVGDLGMRLADHAQQRGLAHVGEAHQTHVSQQLQLQKHIQTLTGQTGLGEAGYLTGGGGEVLVTPAAATALAQDIGLGVGHILDDLAGLRVAHQRAAGHLDDEGLTVLTGAAAALTVHTVFGGVLALVAEVHQRGHIVVHLQDDVAAVTAVTAHRTACGDVFFAMEGNCTVAAVAGAYGNACLVNKTVCHI